MPAARISTFDDWVDLFRVWRNDIGVNYPEIENYQFEAKFGPTRSNEIEFGAFKGRPKWQRVLQIPDQRIRDGLMNLIVYQGDTEFASVEQQRRLFAHSPSEHDRKSLCRVVTEEMRHGWQMCHLLINHFGYSGKVEAQKMLERRAFEQKRLAGRIQSDRRQLARLFHLHRFRRSRRKIPAHDAELFGLRAARAVDESDAARRILPSRHGSRWPEANRESRRCAAEYRAEIHQQVDSGELRPLRRRFIELGALVLRVGLERPLRRSSNSSGSRPRPHERAQSPALSSRVREIDRADQPARSRGTAAAVRS